MSVIWRGLRAMPAKPRIAPIKVHSEFGQYSWWALITTKWLRLLPLLFLLPAVAQAKSEEEQQLQASVSAAGALFGFAQACDLATADINALLRLQVLKARRVAQEKIPNYSAENFKTDFKSGIETANGFTRLVARDSDVYKKNCADIKQKVATILSTNILSTEPTPSSNETTAPE